MYYLKFIFFFFLIKDSISKLLITKKHNNINRERRLLDKDGARALDIEDTERITNIKFSLQSLLNTIDLLSKNFDTRYETIDLLFDKKLMNFKEQLKEREGNLIDKHFGVKLQKHNHRKAEMMEKMERKIEQLKLKHGKANNLLNNFKSEMQDLNNQNRENHIKNMEGIYENIKHEEEDTYKKNKELTDEIDVNQKLEKIDSDELESTKKKIEELENEENGDDDIKY